MTGHCQITGSHRKTAGVRDSEALHEEVARQVNFNAPPDAKWLDFGLMMRTSVSTSINIIIYYIKIYIL